ncbi:MAG: hypothetical protein QQN63_12410 [Nitrosopumilus sp.]
MKRFRVTVRVHTTFDVDINAETRDGAREVALRRAADLIQPQNCSATAISELPQVEDPEDSEEPIKEDEHE